MSAKSVMGAVVTALGLIVIGVTLWYSYLVFMGQRMPPQLFEVELRTEAASGAGLEEQLGSVIEEKLNSVLPPDVVPKTLNLAAWSMFAGVSVFAGSQVSSIGIKLLRS